MTVLNVLLGTDRADLVVDEQMFGNDGRPSCTASKAMVLPHLPALLAVSGTAVLAANLGLLLNNSPCPNGIDDAAELVARHLPRFMALDRERWPAMGDVLATALLIGWAGEMLAGYRVRSWNGCALERLEPGLHLQPEITLSNPEAVATPADLAGVTACQRARGCPMGGGLHCFTLTPAGFSVRPIGAVPAMEADLAA